MTIRPGFRRLTVIVPLGFVAAVSCAGAIAGLMAHQWGALGVFLIPVLPYVLIRIGTRAIRLEVSDDAVLARQGGFRGHPDLEVPRSDVRVIHYFTRTIAFHGAGNERLIEIDCNYTERQMKTVARQLAVPLYNHRRWLGLREVLHGRRVYDPAAPDRDF